LFDSNLYRDVIWITSPIILFNLRKAKDPNFIEVGFATSCFETLLASKNLEEILGRFVSPKVNMANNRIDKIAANRLSFMRVASKPINRLIFLSYFIKAQAGSLALYCSTVINIFTMPGLRFTMNSSEAFIAGAFPKKYFKKNLRNILFIKNLFYLHRLNLPQLRTKW
jgi:hypothetical protein